ncbi:MAG: T9SS type A sorting domain-containing protein [Bacteroidia bacterium]|nr:T9SS type A sorting domain-containing protein [Bacteroidia bacterium]
MTVNTDTTPPIVSNPSQTVSNASGQSVVVQSNKATGKVYIIKSDAPQSTVADLDASVLAGLGGAATVTQSNTEYRISTYSLDHGIYYTYAVDGAGNKSARGMNSININDVLAPDVFVHSVTISNSLRNSVNVRSSESKGYVYLIIEGVPRGTKQQLDAAVGALKGQKAMVTASNVDIPVSVYQLMPGNYRAYAIDNQDNLSTESAETVVITQAGHLKSILAFSFNSLTPAATGQIIGTDISVDVPVGTPVSALVANFTLSSLAKAYVGLVEQINGVTPNNFTNPVVYMVEAEDGSTLEYSVTVSFYTSIDDREWINSVKAYPNPVANHLFIEMSQPADRIEVVNALGQTVNNLIEPGRNVVDIQTDSWMKGIYFIRYYLEEKYVGVQKIIKN